MGFINGGLRNGLDSADVAAVLFRKVGQTAQLRQGVGQVVAVGVNCLPIPRVAPALRALRRGTAKPLVAYPNSGERYDPVTKS